MTRNLLAFWQNASTVKGGESTPLGSLMKRKLLAFAPNASMIDKNVKRLKRNKIVVCT
jgi:hypothetical protein